MTTSLGLFIVKILDYKRKVFFVFVLFVVDVVAVSIGIRSRNV